MILVSQWYEAKSEHRRGELQRCRKRNEDSGLFDRVEYLDGSSRVISFTEMLDHCESKYRGQWCVIANTDITFGSSAYMLRSLKCENRIVALTRWENHSSPRFLGHDLEERFFSGSQDSWAFLAGGVPKPSVDIPLATVGCDQVICGWACSQNIEVIDPALSIKTMHVHSEDDRPQDRGVLYGLYGYPELTTMNAGGDVACHEWPAENLNWQLYRYQK